MASIILPAYNEARVIERSLSSLLRQVESDDEIIVACNGCIDDTADIARRFAPRVTVIDLQQASKVLALNAGDRAAISFPRIYMDADVQLEDGSLHALKQAFAESDLLALSPGVEMDLEGASWFVRAYYDVWLTLPYCRTGLVGAGVYALSEKGRARFGEFPDLIADDGFVRSLFSDAERGMVPQATSRVRAPRTLGWLVKIKTRSRLGVYQLAQRFPEQLAVQKSDYSGAFVPWIRNPLSWPKLAVYSYVNLLTRLLAKQKLRYLAQYQWQTDASAR